MSNQLPVPFTPGPWVIASPEYFDTGLLIQTEQGEPVAICEPTDALDANAALIAEAPNLLVALQGLVADWERVMGRPIPDDHEAKAAITAATGGVPPVWGEGSNAAEVRESSEEEGAKHDEAG